MLVGQCEVILTKPDQTECVRLKLVVIRASTGRCSSLIRANALVYDGDNLKKDISFQSSFSQYCANWNGFGDPESGLSMFTEWENIVKLWRSVPFLLLPATMGRLLISVICVILFKISEFEY